jgi:hypothetical protein
MIFTIFMFVSRRCNTCDKRQRTKISGKARTWFPAMERKKDRPHGFVNSSNGHRPGAASGRHAVHAFNVPRREPIKENDMVMAPVGPMGVSIAVNFQPTGGGRHHRANPTPVARGPKIAKHQASQRLNQRGRRLRRPLRAFIGGEDDY